jgi:hypothetical protein
VPKALQQPDGALQSMQDRVRELENQLKSKTDQRDTVSLLRLENLKERIRQIDESNRADQQRLFDSFRNDGGRNDPSSRAAMSRQVGAIQLQMVRRNQEKSKLKEEMEKLTNETGTKPDVEAETAK